MLQWFISFSEFTEISKSSAPFRKNSNIYLKNHMEWDAGVITEEISDNTMKKMIGLDMHNSTGISLQGLCFISYTVMLTVYYCYHPRMWVDNVFGHVCLSVCQSICLFVCLSVFLSVKAITFEPLDIESSFLACRYTLTISRLSLSIKVIGARSRFSDKNDNLTYFNMYMVTLYIATGH